MAHFPDDAELSSTREKCAGFCRAARLGRVQPWRSKIFDRIQQYVVGGLPKALRALGALAGAVQALKGL